jgi:outer membrane protein assembly factor BamB
MSGTMRLTDELIRAALAPADDLSVPASLADEIRAAVETTPQRRAPLFVLPASPRSRLVIQLVVLGLLALATVGAIWLVGSRHSSLPSSLGVTTYHGGPERNGVMPGPAPAGRPIIEWSTSVTGPIGAGSPVVVDGTVFVADESGIVTALDEATGHVRWSQPVGAAINAGVSVADGLLVVGDDAGIIHAFDIGSGGKERWSYATGPEPVHSAAIIVDGIVYDGGLDGRLFALDLQTGSVRWGPVQTPGSISRSIAFTDGLVFAGSGGTSESDPAILAAYDARSGMMRWSAKLTRGNTSTISVLDGRVFVTGGLDSGSAPDHRLFAFDVSSGSPIWDQAYTASSHTTLLICAAADGLVFACGDDGLLYTIEAASGMLVWTTPIHSSLSPNGGYVGGVLYATSDDHQVHAIDVSTQRESWSVPVAGLPTAPTIVDGRIIVGTSLGKVVSLAAASSPAAGVASTGAP